MQQSKCIHKLSEISVCASSNEMLFSSFTRALKSFRLNGINRMLNSVKGSGLSGCQIFQVIFILPFVNIDNIYRLFRSGLSSQVKGDDNTYYRFLNNPLVPWRKILTVFVNQYMKASTRVSTIDEAPSSPSCLICDDSLLEKRGYKIETIGKVFDHCTHKYILGLKLLVLGLWDGKSFVPLDFSIHNEPGKKKNRGLKSSQLRLQYSNGGKLKLTYKYNAWGELVMETNAKGEETTITYNKLGQINTKIGPEGTTSFVYKIDGPAINQLFTITGFEGDIEEYSYDLYGRLEDKTHTIDGIANTFTYGYDNMNHVTSKTFPSGLSLNYVYNNNGYLETIKDGTNTQTIYDNVSMNAMDQNTNYKSIINGNTQTIDIDYDHITPTTIENGDKTYHDYSWNFASGNLMNRTTDYTGVSYNTEIFTYDNLNRLTSQTVGTNPTLNTNYTNNGNIQDRSNIGTLYNYDQTKINAVSSIEGADYANLSMYNQYIKYTSFDQPEIIKEHGHEMTFTYNSQMQRMKTELSLNSGSSSTRYYLGDYEILIENGITKHIHYVNVGRGVHMIIKRESGTDTYYRTMTDNQGSIVYVGDTNGNEEFYNYDAWGRRRDAATYSYSTSSILFSWMNRGYTGHEHLDDFQLINMNGRLYDPVIARMLSPDNNIQLPFNTQNYNRYSYALNNPLRFTDPDGEIVVGAAVVAVIKAAAIGAAIGVTTNGIANTIQHRPFFDGAGKAAVFGAVGGALSSAVGGVASQLPYNTVGDKIGVAVFQAVGHSWTGAVFAMSQGENPLSGFVGGGASSIVSSGIGNLGLGAATTLVTGGLTGGIGSKLAGGNFWQGVGRGLITTALNHLAHTLAKPDDFIYLLDKDGVGGIGVGHSALLIEGGDGKWYYISKVGSNNSLGVADVDIGNPDGYDSPKKFFESEEGKRYEQGQRVEVSISKSQKILWKVIANSVTKYNIVTNNCDHMCQVALNEVGFKSYSRVPIVNFAEFKANLGSRRSFWWIR